MPEDVTETSGVLRNGTLKIILSVLAALGVLGGGGALLISQQDAEQMVEIGVLQSTQDTLVIDVKEHHEEIDTLKTGIGLINYKQEQAVKVHTRIERTMQRIEEKIDEIPK